MPYVTEQNLTDVVQERWQAVPDPRLRQVMQSLIKHLHAFVREIYIFEVDTIPEQDEQFIREFNARANVSTLIGANTDVQANLQFVDVLYGSAGNDTLASKPPIFWVSHCAVKVS